MTENGIVNDLLRVAIQVLGRIAVKPEQVRAIVGEKKKLIKAFNLCDGQHTQKEIVRKTGLHQGSFSTTSARWAANGIAFRLGDGKDARVLHIYAIPEAGGPRRSKARGRRQKKK
jgi:hypothetical protein